MPAMQMAGSGQHEQMECCECCKDMAKKHEDHVEGGGHGAR
jgi:hypothetical protein